MPNETLVITKAETHLIESSNSSIRDNLARFNRKTKRYSKCWDMLTKTLDMFLNRDILSKITGLPMRQ
jgi:insertion element IS1 protein InsB